MKKSLTNLAIVAIVTVFCVGAMVATADLIDNNSSAPAKSRSGLPFQATKITRGDHSVIHVVGSREQVQSVIDANPDVDQVYGVQPTDKSLRQVHRELDEGMKREFRDISDAIRSVRQR